MDGFIYVLFDTSEPDHIRYVGQTKSAKRLNAHIKEAKYRPIRSHKCNWIRKVLADGGKVQWRQIDAGTDADDLNQKETSWIAHYKSEGHRLTNSTDGGDGVRNPSPEVRAKIAASSRGRIWSDESRARQSEAQRTRPPRPPMSDAQRLKLSEARAGSKLSAEHREKVRLRLIGRPVSDLTRLKMSIAQLGQVRRPLTAEHRAKVSEALKGRVFSEQHRARISAAKAERRKVG
jgi:hypothetical protein